MVGNFSPEAKSGHSIVIKDDKKVYKCPFGRHERSRLVKLLRLQKLQVSGVAFPNAAHSLMSFSGYSAA